MKCSRPTAWGGNVVGCNVCLNCRINRRRVWAHRLFLETFLHSDAAFVTLTYSPEHQPHGDVSRLPTLYPKDAQAWLKRIRKAYYPKKLRYFLAGEYGDRSFRPHYHLAMFGMPTCLYGRSQYEAPYLRKNCCLRCDVVRDTWGRGSVHLDELNLVTAGYVVGYVTKGFTGRRDARLKGRYPEFARMSLRPGLGAEAIDLIAPKLIAQGHHYITATGDVPGILSHDGKSHPIGRYLKERLRGKALHAGFVLSSPADTPEAQERAQELRAMWRRRQADSPIKVTLDQAVYREYVGMRAAMLARHKFAKERKL